MYRQERACFAVAASLLLVLAARAAAEDATLILTGTRVWTADADQPRAEAVAVAGDKILAVGSAETVFEHRGANTRVVELPGRFIAPGFIDNHTHFNRAGALLLGVNPLDVADEPGLVQRLSEARERLPAGSWIVGGDWGAYEAWAQGSAGDEDAGPGAAFTPDRRMIDRATASNPVLLRKWDGSLHLANARALQRLLVSGQPDPRHLRRGNAPDFRR